MQRVNRSDSAPPQSSRSAVANDSSLVVESLAFPLYSRHRQARDSGTASSSYVNFEVPPDPPWLFFYAAFAREKRVVFISIAVIPDGNGRATGDIRRGEWLVSAGVCVSDAPTHRRPGQPQP